MPCLPGEAMQRGNEQAGQVAVHPCGPDVPADLPRGPAGVPSPEPLDSRPEGRGGAGLASVLSLVHRLLDESPVPSLADHTPAPASPVSPAPVASAATG